MLPTLYIRQVPLLRIALLMIIGMSIARRCSNGNSIELWFLGISIILLLTFQQISKSPLHRSLLLNINAISIGALLLITHLSQSQPNEGLSEILQSDRYKVIEIEEYTIGTNYHTLHGSVLAVNDTDVNTQNVSIVLKSQATAPLTIERGQLIVTNARLSAIVSKELANGFNYGQYLKDQGFVYQGFSNQENLKRSNYKNYPWWKRVRYDLRNKSIAVVNKYLSAEPNKITKALVLGDRSGLDSDRHEYW